MGRTAGAGGSVKLEGGQRSAETVRHLVEAGIPVMGHIGLTPQSVNQTSGFRVQGKTPRDAVHLIGDAKALADAGAYAIVLELVPTALAQMITQRVSVPTIGIGAGPFCSGQVQVWHDILGLYDDLKPRHARRFVELGTEIRGARHDQKQFEVLPVPDHLWGDVDGSAPFLTRFLEVFQKQPVGDRLFIDAILENRSVTPSLYDGYKAQQVIDAAIESHQSGTWISLA